MSARVFAPAKINLTLEVGPLKANGRHPLQSVVAFADVGDWVQAEPAPALTLAISGPFAAELNVDEDNLVLRAARALAARAGIKASGAALRLEKNLPLASGIGGGSADAAAALRALNTLWGQHLGEAELMDLGQSLGADVPACVFARSAYMTGEGETIAPIRLPVMHAVLVNPAMAAPTADVFRQFDSMAGGSDFAATAAPNWVDFEAVCTGAQERGNMLAPAARIVAPIIDAVGHALSADRRARYVNLSGSGATMFALTAGAADASGLAVDLSRAYPDWWVAATRLAAT